MLCAKTGPLTKQIKRTQLRLIAYIKKLISPLICQAVMPLNHISRFHILTTCTNSCLYDNFVQAKQDALPLFSVSPNNQLKGNLYGLA